MLKHKLSTERSSRTYFKSVTTADKLMRQGTPETASVQNENERNNTYSNLACNHNNIVKPMTKLAALNVSLFIGNYQEFKDIFSA